MILKIEGTDREIINFVEGAIELSLTGSEHRTSNIEHPTSTMKMSVSKAKGNDKKESRPGDDLFWRLFYGLYLHKNGPHIDIYDVAARKTAEEAPGALIPTKDQVSEQLSKLDREFVFASRSLISANGEIERIFPQLCPIGKPAPYSGGQNNPQEKKEAEAAHKKEAKKEEAKPAKKKAAKKNKPAKTNSPKPKAREITIQEIKDEVPLEECTSIPEVIEAILTICSTSASSLARALELSPSDISVAKNGKVYPYIERAFKQYLQFGDTSPSE